jgi:hypothetical protein
MPTTVNTLLRPVSIPCQMSRKKLARTLESLVLASHSRAVICWAPPKISARSVERAYLRRRQPWEEATTIKTLVPGLSPHGIVDRTVQPWRVRLGYGVVTADPCGRTRTPKLIVASSLISRGARQLTRNPEMHFFALIRQFT